METSIYNIDQPESLEEVIDTKQIQNLMNLFYKATDIPVGIIGATGKVIIATGWQEICTCFHRKNPESEKKCYKSDLYIANNLKENKVIEYQCQNGLMEMGYPIIINGRHLATIMIGQFFFSEEDRNIDFFKEQARNYGFNVAQYMEALAHVPIISRERALDIMDYYAEFAKMLAQMGYQNLEKTNELHKRYAIEQSLIDSQNQLDLALEGAKEGLWKWNVSTGQIFLAGVSSELAGLAPSQKILSLRSFLKLLSKKYRDKLEEVWLDHLSQSEKSFRLELELRKPGGGKQWFMLTGKITERLPNGKAQKVYGTIIDIGLIKMQERAVRAGEAKHRSLSEAAPMGVLYLNKQYEINYRNPLAIKLLSLNKGQKNIHQLLANNPTLKHEIAVAMIKNQKSVFEEKVNIMGLKKWLRCHFSPISEGKNQPDGVLLLIEDITKEVNTRQQLTDFQARLNMALESSDQGVWEYDIEANQKTHGSHIGHMLGYPNHAINGHPDKWLNLIHEDDRDNINKALQDHLNGRKPDYKAEFRVRNSWGHIRWFLSRGRITERGAEQEPRKLVGIHTDITERKEAEMAIERAIADANEASAQKSAFLANMSHEIRTPMNGIMGMSNLLSETNLDPVQKEYLRLIKVSGETLLGLIDDILDLSKIEAGKLDIVDEVVNLRKLIDSLAQIMRVRLNPAMVTLSYQIDKRVPDYILTDSIRLQQILTNLLGNACKFTKKGTINLSVSELPNPENQKRQNFYFEVSDTGIGIPENKQHQIFEAFTQASVRRPDMPAGAGLGLTISKRLVKAMGGQIGLKSEVGTGSTFYFNILAGIVKELPQNHPADVATTITNATNQYTRLKLLLAEDNEINTHYFTALFKKMGHNCLTACNGKEALKLYGLHNFDAIFMDLHMPEMDGEAALRAIRTLEEDKKHKTYVVAITATALQGERQRLIELGFDDYMSKPIDHTKLIAKINRLSHDKLNKTYNKVEIVKQKNANLAKANHTKKLIDEESLQQRQQFLGKETLANMALVFMEELEERLNTLETLLQTNPNPDTVFNLTHKIKNSLGYFATKDFYTSVAVWDDLAKANKLNELQTKVSQLRPKMKQIVEETKAYCAQHCI